MQKLMVCICVGSVFLSILSDFPFLSSHKHKHTGRRTAICLELPLAPRRLYRDIGTTQRTPAAAVVGAAAAAAAPAAAVASEAGSAPRQRWRKTRRAGAAVAAAAEATPSPLHRQHHHPSRTRSMH